MPNHQHTPNEAATPPSVTEVLQAFVEDVEAAYPQEDLPDEENALGREWPDLLVTYRDAKRALQRQDRLRWDTENPLKIRRWLRSGEVGELKDTREVLRDAGSLLDAACSGEILGDVVFQGEDDVYYVATVEAAIDVANPELVRELLDENENVYTAEYWDENRGLWIVLRCGDLNQAIDHARSHLRAGRKARVVEDTYDAVIQVWPQSGMAPTEQRGKREANIHDSESE